ncbi:preprotein translocase subunit SecY [Candidatus Gracilibacteria bacterium]|nr:MAG: preprotein translocase subunit SecY [Candidatus Gracilibacteria bacterium]
MLPRLKKIWNTQHIRKKIIFTLLMIVVYKVLASITVPGVNVAVLSNFTEQLRANAGLSFFGSIMGGGLEQFSIILMGLAPYINATIILQLLGVIVPSLEALKKEGEQGQKKLNNYTRYLTVPLALAQSYGMILLLNTVIGTGNAGAPIIDTSNFWGVVFPAMLVITAGTMILLWLGDLISESGVGNGTSIIIFAGVLAAVPQKVIGYINTQEYVMLIVLALLTVGVIYVIVRFTEGYRKVPLIYTRTGRDERSHFPIRINQAGMVPIIFAVALITFPSIVGQILAGRESGMAADIGNWMVTHLSMNNPSWIYILIYFLLVVGFSFFYVSITFNTKDVAESIQKRGGYIPGIRPGKETAEYLEKTSNRLNLFGGSFLALIAVFPYLMTKLNTYLEIFPTTNQIDFLISGSGLIIVVGVILDIIRRIDTDMKSFNYKKFY